MSYSASYVGRHAPPKHVLKILVPVDFSDASNAALTHAVRMAMAHDAEVEVLHVWDVPSYTGAAIVPGENVYMSEHVRAEAARSLEEMLAAQGEEAQAFLHGRLESGDPATVILEASRTVQLVVMGAHNQHSSLSELLFGSVADKVVSDASCPVITLREDGEPDEVAQHA